MGTEAHNVMSHIRTNIYDHVQNSAISPCVCLGKKVRGYITITPVMSSPSNLDIATSSDFFSAALIL